MIYEPIPKAETRLDTEALIDSLSAYALGTYQKILPLVSDKSIVDKRVLESANLFISTYINAEGVIPEVKPKSILALSEFLMANISTISGLEMTAAAKHATETTADQVSFFIPSHRRAGAKFSAPESQNSNEFMLKLAMRETFANKIQVQLIREKAVPRLRTDEIRIIDDAAYSGEQMDGTLEHLFKLLKPPRKVAIFLAGVTDHAIEKWHKTAAKFPGISLNVKAVRRIPTMYDLTHDHPEFRTFFGSAALGSVYEYNQLSDPTDREDLAQKEIEYVDSITLTKTEFKVPDPMSFPDVVSRIFKKTPNDNLYPKVAA